MTARPIRSSELLDLAGRLAGKNAGKGKPGTVELRRAVSTAYYALLHELTNQATQELLGSDPEMEPQRHQASRWFAHTDIKLLAEAATGGKSTVAPVLGSPHTDLVRVAEAFLSLQEARHRADYDHTYGLRRRDALLLVADAEDAINRARKLRDRADASYRRSLKLMIGAVKIAKNR